MIGTTNSRIKEIKIVPIIKQNPSVSTSSISPSSKEDRGLTKGEKLNNKVNINKAGVDELDKLSGIGPAMAQKIIEYRTQNNGFRDIREIKLVKGIGDKIYEKIEASLEI
jgi:competence protein ComEA